VETYAVTMSTTHGWVADARLRDGSGLPVAGPCYRYGKTGSAIAGTASLRSTNPLKGVVFDDAVPGIHTWSPPV
jgi:hypothetical protein